MSESQQPLTESPFVDERFTVLGQASPHQQPPHPAVQEAMERADQIRRQVLAMSARERADHLAQNEHD